MQNITLTLQEVEDIIKSYLYEYGICSLSDKIRVNYIVEDVNYDWLNDNPIYDVTSLEVVVLE